MTSILIFCLCNFIILLSISVSFSRYTITSIFSLVCVFIGISFIFFFLEMEYIAFIYIAVYAGAIAVLFIFVIMLLGASVETPISISIFQSYLIFSFILFTNYIILCTPINVFCSYIYTPVFTLLNLNSILTIGIFLFTKYSHLTILISLILFISMIGSLVLTIRVSTDYFT